MYSPYNEYIQGEEIAKYIKENYKVHYEIMQFYIGLIWNQEYGRYTYKKKNSFVLLDKEYNFFNHFICKDLLAI